MLPTYGVDWSTSLFENDNVARPAISAAIRSAIAKWIPEVSVNSISFKMDQIGGVETVTLGLILPDSTVTNLNINTNILNYDGTIAG
jgi:phage baseplate assembly protein W